MVLFIHLHKLNIQTFQKQMRSMNDNYVRSPGVCVLPVLGHSVPVVMDGELARLAAGADQEAAAHQHNTRGEALQR